MQSTKKTGAGISLLLAGIILGGALCAFAWFSKQIQVGVALPVLAILGVIALLLALALAAGAFSIFDLSDRTQALGLPEGSVRAVIALSLVVLFAILSIYLYADVSHPTVETHRGLTEPEKTKLLEAVPAALVIAVVEEPRAGQGDKRFTAIWRNASAAGEDFAKQLLVLIGTLVTSVSSFYFGAKSVASAAPAPAAVNPPNVRSVLSTPATPARGAPVDLQVSGDNLDTVKDVKLMLGQHQENVAVLSVSASILKCRVVVPTSAPAGAWDIVVGNASGQQSRLPAAVTLT